jgi:hypothetical protein
MVLHARWSVGESVGTKVSNWWIYWQSRITTAELLLIRLNPG